MINPKKINEALPGYKLVNNKGTTELRNPKEETVAKYDDRRGVFEIDGDHPDHEAVINCLQKAGSKIEINRESNPKPKKAQGWGNAQDLVYGLRGLSGQKFKLEIDHEKGTAIVWTNVFEKAQALKNLFINEPRAHIHGTIGLYFNLTVPSTMIGDVTKFFRV